MLTVALVVLTIFFAIGSISPLLASEAPDGIVAQKE